MCVTVTALMFLAVCSSAFAEEELSVCLAEADRLYKEFLITEDCKQIEAAKNLLDELIRTYPDHAEIFWKTARCYIEYAAFADDPIAIYEAGITLAKRSSEICDNAEAHFWLAALYGLVGQAKGIFNSLALVKPIREELEQCITLNPAFDYAYHVLARFYQEVPGKPISIGDRKKALEYEQKAVQLVPNHFPYQWGLYQIYRKLKLEQEAVQVLQVILELPLEYEFDRVYREDLTDAEIKELAAQELSRL